MGEHALILTCGPESELELELEPESEVVTTRRYTGQSDQRASRLLVTSRER